MKRFSAKKNVLHLKLRIVACKHGLGKLIAPVSYTNMGPANVAPKDNPEEE